MSKIKVGTLIFALVIPLVVGMISAALTSKGMATYGTMAKPPLSPPAWAFPVAWTILYLMMGLASYFIIVANVDNGSKMMPIFLYAVQLAMNFMWSIIFFNREWYLMAFIWLAIMWCVVVMCAVKSFPVSRGATYLLIPYIAWLTFAGYLNMGAVVLR